MDEYTFMLCAIPFFIIFGLLVVGYVFGVIADDDSQIKWQVRK